MDKRYMRNIPALTEQECLGLREKKVLVVGCGGLGGYIIEMLARVGVGSIRAVDGDCFEESNLNRQLLSAPALLGVPKTEAAKARVERINPDVKVETVQAFLDGSNAEELISGCDVVMDALDNIESRRVLAKACEKTGTPYVYGAIAGWVAQAAVSMPGDGFVQKLYPQDAVVRDKSSLAFTPALCAALQCALCIRLLSGRGVESGKLYFCDLLNMEFEAIALA